MTKRNNEVEKREENFDSDIYLGIQGSKGKFLRGEYIVEKLGITEKTLYALAESGEFSLGRVAGKEVVLADSFFDYLDRNHFTKRKNKSDEPAIDSKGRIKYKLTPVKERHTDILDLIPIQKFAEDLGIEKRTFTRHCDSGTFKHYRIGTLYKMSVKDYEDSLKKAAETNQKSKRGQRGVGRPKVTIEKAQLIAEKQEDYVANS